MKDRQLMLIRNTRKDYNNNDNNTQQNINSRLCGDKDEMVNDIISECRKLELKEIQDKHDWVEKVSHWDIVWEIKIWAYK